MSKKLISKAKWLSLSLLHSLVVWHWLDLIGICIRVEFVFDQFPLWIPLGVQTTDTTASRGLTPKPPESGWYPRCLLLWLNGVSVRKDTQSYEYFSLCYDDPAPGQEWPREGECGLPSLPYGVSIRTRDWHFATSLVCVTKTQCL